MEKEIKEILYPKALGNDSCVVDEDNSLKCTSSEPLKNLSISTLVCKFKGVVH